MKSLPTKSKLTIPVYEDDLVSLYRGDGRSFMLGQAPQVDAIITDPPYGDTALDWDRSVDGWLELAGNLTNALWCFGSMRFFMRHASDFEQAGWRYAQEIIWEKQNGSGFNTDRFKRVHEMAVQWYTGPWGDLHHDVPLVQGERRISVRSGPSRAEHRGEIGKSTYDRTERLTRSVLQVRNEQKRAVHPTQKPTGILRPLIQYSVPAGGVVLDPFAGSGSTLLAARELGRYAVGVELDPGYCAAAVGRLSQTEMCVEAHPEEVFAQLADGATAEPAEVEEVGMNLRPLERTYR